MPAITTTVEPELLDIRTISQMGYGHPATIRARIRRGTIPAYRSGGKFKIHRDDLHRIAEPVGATARPRVPASNSELDGDGDLDELVQQIVATFPRLSGEQKSELGRLLGGAAR